MYCFRHCFKNIFIISNIIFSRCSCLSKRPVFKTMYITSTCLLNRENLIKKKKSTLKHAGSADGFSYKGGHSFNPYRLLSSSLLPYSKRFDHCTRQPSSGDIGNSIMPKNADVFLYYGPYESCWITDYRTKRLEGLIKMLTKDGHSVKLKKVPDLNAVKLWVNGELVFSCDITDLNFGGDGELDKLCHQAVNNVRNAF